MVYPAAGFSTKVECSCFKLLDSIVNFPSNENFESAVPGSWL